MDWGAKLGALEQRLRALVAQRIDNIIDELAGTIGSPDGETDATAGLPSSEQSQRPVHRRQHAGFVSRLAAARRVVIRKGTREWSVAEDDGQGVTADEGQAKIYAPGNSAAMVNLGADGSVALTSDTAGSKDVQVNGGTLKVARDTDPTMDGTIVCSVAGPVAGVSTATITYTAPGGSPQTIAVLAFTGTGTGGGATLSGKINGGAARFKA